MNKGILYIATGEQFLKEASISAKRVQKFTDLPIAIVTDLQDKNGLNHFDKVITLEDPNYSFIDQPYALQRTPFDRTLYIDTDIYADAEFEEIFEVLDQFEIAASHNQNRTSYPVASVPESFPEYNTGVLVYRNSDRLMNFLDTWIDIYRSGNTNESGQNQPSFRKALYKSNLRIATLPPEYNLMVRYPGHAIGEVKFFHGRLLDIETPGAGQYHDVPSAAKKINAVKDHRVYTQIGGINVHSNREDKIYNKIRLSIQRYGLRNTAYKAIKKIK